jgi:hypothetical protein
LKFLYHYFSTWAVISLYQSFKRRAVFQDDKQIPVLFALNNGSAPVVTGSLTKDRISRCRLCMRINIHVVNVPDHIFNYVACKTRFQSLAASAFNGAVRASCNDAPPRLSLLWVSGVEPMLQPSQAVVLYPQD